jgi:L-ascorbate metabolism protein UlaG (beta-lactamase superfamily)
VLTAPLFSNPGLFRTGVWTIASDTAVVDRFMSRYDVSRARAILVGHAHYDHLMDVPRVALAHARDARIVGNRTVASTLGTWSGVGDRVDVVNDSVGDMRTVGRWLRYGPRVRVMALRSKHAPHFEGLTLYQGTRDRPMAEMPRVAAEWLDGETVAFLIDFLDDTGDVAFRIYYQDAVVAPPYGQAPEALIAERPFDVAILTPATFDQVDWHPEALVETLRPRYVLLGHWEDFFVPVAAPARSIRLTDLGHFERRLEAVHDGDWWRPDLWTEFRLPRR